MNPPLSSNYNRTKSGDGLARRLRPALIFAAIAGLAAGGVYFLLPGSPADRTEQVEPQAVAPEQLPAPETTAEAVPVKDNAAVEVMPADPAPAVPASDAGVPDPEVGTSKAERALPVGGEEGPPVKGVPHSSDPVIDHPVIPANTGVDPAPHGGTMAINPPPAGGNPVEVRDRAHEALAGLTPDSAPWREAAKQLTRANIGIYFDAPPETHEIKSGDTMYRIAHRYRTTIEALLRQNKLKNSNQIRVGQKIKVHPGDWKILIGKNTRLLKVYDGDRLFLVYDIGIGRQGRTPSGSFVISDKQANPAYYAPDGRVIPHGQPGNEMGSRWLRLQSTDQAAGPLVGYGIHGTADESSVTRSLSSGCIRMRNADVEELFVIVPTGTPVLIEE
jgi:lipoprotein-anchoring transpeptidase ErfK/SrfK